jgi:hypothetical protein
MGSLQYELLHVGIGCYLERFIDTGFNTWESVKYIKESDVKAQFIGHALFIF